MPVAQGTLRVVVWELTLRCNLACNHCGSRAGAARAHELTTEECLDVVRQLAQARVEEVTLIGGEAYLRPDWDTIARAITERGMRCSMVTGGRGLDAELARRAHAAGVVHVAVSVDGLEATHDALRGVPGSHRAALAALRHLRDAGVSTSVNTQVNRRSLPELEALIDEVAAEGIWAWRPTLTVAMGRAADQPELLLQPYELLELFPRLVKIKVALVTRGMMFVLGNTLGYFGPYESFLRGEEEPGGHWSGCRAGDDGLGIEADGTLKACPSLPTAAYAGGNLRDRPLQDMLDRSPQIRFTRDRTPGALWGYCGSCYYANVCRAGCTWTSHVLLGRPGNMPYCHHRALEYQKKGLRERLEPIEKPPGVPFDHGLFRLVLEPIPEEETSDD